MISIVKLWFAVGILLTAWTLPLAAHQNYKNISKGVIEVSGDIYFIVSPANRYQIRKKDNHIVKAFLKKNKTKNVKAKLVRKTHSDLWTIKSLVKR